MKLQSHCPELKPDWQRQPAVTSKVFYFEIELLNVRKVRILNRKFAVFYDVQSMSKYCQTRLNVTVTHPVNEAQNRFPYYNKVNISI